MINIHLTFLLKKLDEEISQFINSSEKPKPKKEKSSINEKNAILFKNLIQRCITNDFSSSPFSNTFISDKFLGTIQKKKKCQNCKYEESSFIKFLFLSRFETDFNSSIFFKFFLYVPYMLSQ